MQSVEYGERFSAGHGPSIRAVDGIPGEARADSESEGCDRATVVAGGLLSLQLRFLLPASHVAVFCTYTSTSCRLVLDLRAVLFSLFGTHRAQRRLLAGWCIMRGLCRQNFEAKRRRTRLLLPIQRNDPCIKGEANRARMDPTSRRL